MRRPIRLRPDGIAWSHVDGELVLLDVRSSSYLSGNAAAATLWDLLAAGADRHELARRLATAFGIDEAHAARDVDAFVTQLRDLDLVLPS